MMSTHSSAANTIRIGHDRSILCLRGAPSAGNAMVMAAARLSSANMDHPRTSGARILHCRHRGDGAPRLRGAWRAQWSMASHPENLGVARLDLIAHLLDALGVLFHQLDV